jgi:hypothetical protein
VWFLFWFSFDSLQINEIFDQIDSEYVCCYVVTSRLLTASTIINDQSIMQIIALFFSLKFLDSCTGLNDFELFKCTNQTPVKNQMKTKTKTTLLEQFQNPITHCRNRRIIDTPTTRVYMPTHYPGVVQAIQ